MKKLTMLLVCAAMMIIAVAGTAQDQDKAPQPKCSAPEHRQFDFWVGEWDVTQTQNGNPAGTSSVTAILDGCVLFEQWQSANGTYSGKSFNRYDPNLGKWKQLWVDNQGGVLDLVGEYNDGKMILGGESTANGKKVLNRITWHNNESDGTVRQVWETSQDGGESWKTVFDGLYKRKG